MSGIQQEWIDAIRYWAARERLVLAVYAFGSRVKGGSRADSDLDLGLIVYGRDEDEAFANWCSEAEAWRDALGMIVPVAIDLQPIFQDDRVVGPAVSEHGLKIYSVGS